MEMIFFDDSDDQQYRVQVVRPTALNYQRNFSFAIRADLTRSHGIQTSLNKQEAVYCTQINTLLK